MGSIIKSQKKDSLQPKEIYQKKLSLSKLDLEKIKRYTNSSTYLKIKANMPLQKEKSRLPTINKSIPFTLLKRNKNIRSISEDLHTQKKPNNESLSIIQSREKLKEKTRRDSINFPKNKATKQLMKV